MLWDIMNKSALEAEARRAAAAAASSATDAGHRLDELEGLVHRQTLIIKALMALCEQANVFSEAVFRDMVDFIDIQDGVLDGKLTPEKEPRVCPSCERKSPHLAKVCLWCRAALPPVQHL